MAMTPRYNENREYENLINEIRVEKGFTLKNLATLIGVSSAHMWNISQGYSGPYWFNSGKLKEWAVKLEQVLGTDLSEIFPREVCSIQTSNLTNDQLAYIAHGYIGPTHGDTEVDRIFKCLILQGGIQYLTSQEKFVLAYRYEKNKSFNYIGEVVGLSTERIRQIERFALAVLRGYMWVKENNGYSNWSTNCYVRRKRAINKRDISLQPIHPYGMLLNCLPKKSMFK